MGAFLFDYDDDLPDISASEFLQNHDKYSSKVGYGIVLTISFREVMPEWAMGAQGDLSELQGQTLVPDLTGMTVEEAKQELEDYGLVLGDIVYIDSDDKEANYIVSKQNPSPDAEVSPGERVDVNMELKK